MSFPSFQQFMQIATEQLSLRKLTVGEYKGHRYLINILPRMEGAGMYQKPSTAYMEVATEDIEFMKQLEWENRGYVTWEWYPDKKDRWSENPVASITEGYIEGLHYSAELGIDENTDSAAMMLEAIKQLIDNFEKEKAKKANTEETMTITA